MTIRTSGTPQRAFGDFQTPPGLVSEVLRTLEPIASRWPRVLEPTCGQGNFLAGLLDLPAPPREIQAIEIQAGHHQAAARLAQSRGHSRRVVVKHANFFDVALARDLNWRTRGPLLVVGNPPWVTSATLGQIECPPLLQPPRRQDTGLSGLSSRTGSSNFDVAEAVWLKLIREFSGQPVTMALLCKTSVARRVLQFTRKFHQPLSYASIRAIDAAQYFAASVDACLLTLSLHPDGAHAESIEEIPVYRTLDASTASSFMGFSGNDLISDRATHRRFSFADGQSPRVWRQGVKHDAATIMEVSRSPDSNHWINSSGEIVDVEPQFLYPLMKAADLALKPANRVDRAVIITQQKIGANTTVLAQSAPRLWAYLQSHAIRFERRKSSVYRNQPPYAIFGVGPYTFAPFKVAISGLRKQPTFTALGSRDGKPFVVDDTSYLLPCVTACESALLTALCNDPISLGLIRSCVFLDAKRSITKALLQRIDLRQILARADGSALVESATSVLCEHLGVSTSVSWVSQIEQIEREFETRV